MTSSDGGWISIDPHELVLEGRGGRVTMEVDAFLPSPSTLACSDALAMTTTVTIDSPNSDSPMSVSVKHALYGSITSIHERLRAFSAGRAADVTIEAVGLRLKLYSHSFGARSGTCVSGDVSSVSETDNFPWPKAGIGDRLLLEREAAFRLQFGFLTSVVDPPYVTRFAESARRLMEYIESFRAK